MSSSNRQTRTSLNLIPRTVEEESTDFTTFQELRIWKTVKKVSSLVLSICLAADNKGLKISMNQTLWKVKKNPFPFQEFQKRSWKKALPRIHQWHNICKQVQVPHTLMDLSWNPGIVELLTTNNIPVAECVQTTSTATKIVTFEWTLSPLNLQRKGNHKMKPAIGKLTAQISTPWVEPLLLTSNKELVTVSWPKMIRCGVSTKF